MFVKISDLVFDTIIKWCNLRDLFLTIIMLFVDLFDTVYCPKSFALKSPTYYN